MHLQPQKPGFSEYLSSLNAKTRRNPVSRPGLQPQKPGFYEYFSSLNAKTRRNPVSRPRLRKQVFLGKRTAKTRSPRRKREFSLKAEIAG